MLKTLDPYPTQPSHSRAPADVLRNDYLRPRALSVNALARLTGIPARRLNRILKGAPIKATDAARLAAAFGTSELYWMVLQVRRDLEAVRNRRTVPLLSTGLESAPSLPLSMT